MSSRNCGFPIDWFVEQPKDFLICSICLEVLNDPHCCRNGHNFCKSCILEALQIKQECPECKISLKDSLLTKNLAVRNMVLDCSVPCPHLRKTFLCGWVGSLSNRSAHEANCPEIIVACPLREWKLCTSECTGMLRRGDLQNHMCKSVESELKLICDLSTRLKTNTYKLKQFEKVAEQTVGYVARPEADGTIYCGQVSKAGEKHGYGTIYRNQERTGQGNFINGKIHGDHCYLRGDDGSQYNGQIQSGLYHGVGKIFYCDKSSYEGEWKDGKWHGKGHWKRSNGFEYIGDFVNRMVHGKGKMTCADKSVYEGDFSMGQKHGNGHLKTVKGDIYVGTFVKGLMHGQGLMKYADGGSYRGQFQNDNRSGRGVHALANGDVIEGTFRAGAAEGQTTVNYKNRNVFRGIFVNGKANGHGTFHEPNGSLLYQGEFKDGLKHGSGVGAAMWLGKSTYKYNGQWERGSMHGKGVLTSITEGDKFRYSGSFVNGNRHGQGDKYVGTWENDACQIGTLTLTDGTVCTGEFHNSDVTTAGCALSKGRKTLANGNTFEGSWDKNGFMHGSGTSTVLSADGQKTECYAGTFVDGKKHGKGKLTLANGDVYTGEFKDDKMHGKGQLKRKGVRKLVKGEWVEGVLEQQQA